MAGGAEGLLLSFVQEKLDEIPEQLRGPLLTGLVLALVDPTSNQRVAGGATTAEIAHKAQAPENLMTPYLDRLIHPRVRLLEKTVEGRYRLPHERLVPVLRRLAGLNLAEKDQVRIQFENEFRRWCEAKASRRLLRGKDLALVLHNQQSLVQGEDAAQKEEYITASMSRRTRFRLAAVAVVLVLAVCGYWGVRWTDTWIQRDRLSSWGLSPALFDLQYEADWISIRGGDISFTGGNVNDLAWLRSRHVKELFLHYTGPNLEALSRLTGLTSLTLNLSDSSLQSLSPLEKLTGLTSLALDLDNSNVQSLSPLDKLTGLKSLTLNLWDSPVRSFSPLEKLTGLTSLTLVDSPVQSLPQLEKLTSLKSLTLDLSDSPVQSLSPLEKLTGLTSLTLVGPPGQSLPKLEKLTSLKSLTLDLRFKSVQSLSPLEKLTGLISLTLTLGPNVQSLPQLEKLTSLKSLTLDLSDSSLQSLSPLEKLTGLTSLTLVDRPVPSLSPLEKLTGLTSLTLTLGPNVQGLPQFEKLTGLTSLELDLSRSNVQNLSPLEKLTSLKSLTLRGATGLSLSPLEKLTGLTSLTLAGRLVQSLSPLEKLTSLKSLTLDLSRSNVQSLSPLEKLTSLKSLTLDLRNGTQVQSLSVLNSLASADDLQILVPVNLLSSFPDNDHLRGVTKVTLRIGSKDNRISIAHGFKYVSLSQ